LEGLGSTGRAAGIAGLPHTDGQAEVQQFQLALAIKCNVLWLQVYIGIKKMRQKTLN